MYAVIKTEENVITIFHERIKKKVWAFAGGKGGTGKTAIAANLGLALATFGYRVILVDADLGGANLHTILGIRNPPVTLSDFITHREESLFNIIMDTPNENLKLISGGNEIIGMANLPYQSKMRVKKHIMNLQADYILLDLGAGSNYNVIDFFTMTDEGIIITNPEPTAKLNGYAFLKNCVYRLLNRHFYNNHPVREILANAGKKGASGTYTIPDIIKMASLLNGDVADQMKELLSRFQPKLIMNKVRKSHHIQEGEILIKLARKFLGVKLGYLGTIEEDENVMEATENMMPFVLLFPKCSASRDVYRIIGRMGVEDQLGRVDTGRIKKFHELSKMKRIMRTESGRWI